MMISHLLDERIALEKLIDSWNLQILFISTI